MIEKIYWFLLKNHMNWHYLNEKTVSPQHIIFLYSMIIKRTVVCQTIYGMIACLCEKVKNRIVSNETPGKNFELKGEPSWENVNLLIGFLKVEQYGNRKIFNACKMGNWLNFYDSSTL